MSDRQANSQYFTKDFLWGAATAAHQVEGGLQNDWTVWEAEHAKTLAAQAPYKYKHLDNWPEIEAQATEADNYRSADGVDHYNRYEQDFALLEQLHLNAFRFGIEWARIEPQEGVWDIQAVTHYKQYLKALTERGITPVVTLFHFTLPVWFAQKGGFTKRSNIRYFLRFAQKVLEEYSPYISYLITVNEPTVYVGESYINGVWPPNQHSKWQAYRVVRNLIRAHKQIYNLAHTNNSRLRVSMAHHLSDYYPGDDAWLTQRSTQIANYFGNHYIIKRVAKHSDFLGINYYQSHRIFGYRVHNPDTVQVNDLGWDMQPGRLAPALEGLAERYLLPIMITENGLADAADNYRQWWLAETIKAMNLSLQNGVPLVGYLHWSLLDNFEWDKGYWPKFGLVAVDRQTMQRHIRPSGRWYGLVVQRLRRASRQ